jgi:hypothetical protein
VTGRRSGRGRAAGGAGAAHPTAPPDIDAYLARFAWHPEPELIGYLDEGASREAMRELGEETWATALDFVYEHATERAMGDPGTYEQIRRGFYGTADRPGPAPASPTPAAEILTSSSALAGG